MTDDPETYSEEETKRRAEAALKRMLATPHKPHKPIGKKEREKVAGADGGRSSSGRRSNRKG